MVLLLILHELMFDKLNVSGYSKPFAKALLSTTLTLPETSASVDISLPFFYPPWESQEFFSTQYPYVQLYG